MPALDGAELLVVVLVHRHHHAPAEADHRHGHLLPVDDPPREQRIQLLFLHVVPTEEFHGAVFYHEASAGILTAWSTAF